MSLIEVKGLAKHYGDVHAVRGLDLTIEQGEIFSILGPNGAGKTSLLRSLAGLSEWQEGSLRFEGGDAELGIGAQSHFIAHQEAVKPALTARENLEFWQVRRGSTDD